VESTTSLEEMLEWLSLRPIDVIILDRMIHGKDSLPLIPRIRLTSPMTKIMVLSALGELDERVSGLSMGADDYLPKPFHVSELLARVSALGRRSDPEKSLTKKMELNGISILLDQQQASYQGKPLSLTGKELRLLILFLEHPNKVFSRMELLERVWGYNFDPESNVVEVTIKRLRGKLTEVGATELIHTRRGSGYSFSAET
jgi:two-component system OmpR family response regulator